MLVEFSVENYQAFGKRQRVPIKPITLIFGPNGAGKSALLKSLLVSRHAVLEGELNKSKGALDRHPGTFKAMQRNKSGPDDTPSIRFGWTLYHVDEVANNTERLDLQWAEITSQEIHIQRLALYCNEKLFIEDDGNVNVRFGQYLDDELNATIERLLGRLTLNAEDHSAIFEKMKETFLRELKLEYEGWLFPGSVEGFHAFNFDEHLEDRLREALSSHIPNSRWLTKLIKRIEEAASSLLHTITEPLGEFHESLKTELESFVYHGPIRPVYDEIKATDTFDFQSGEWLKLATNRNLCEKVNHWLASAAGNQSMQVVVSRVVTVHDLRNVMCENVTLDDIYIRAYDSYIFARKTTHDHFHIYLSNLKGDRVLSTKQQEVLCGFLADRLAHDMTINAAAAEAASELGLGLPSHYLKDHDGNYSADMSAILPHLRHRKPDAYDAWNEYLQLGAEQRLEAAREFHALLAGRGEMRRAEDFLLKGMNGLLSAMLEQLEDPNQAADLHKVLFVDKRTKKAVQASNLGLGFSQMLPLVISAFACENQLIAIEQPELHLHPAMQTELADLFIQSAKERGNRFIIETHSEHLILRVLRRIRETNDNTLPPGKTPIRPEEVAVLYVKPGENGSEVIEIPVTEDGDFAVPWPGGFFAERADELF